MGCRAATPEATDRVAGRVGAKAVQAELPFQCLRVSDRLVTLGPNLTQTARCTPVSPSPGQSNLIATALRRIANSQNEEHRKEHQALVGPAHPLVDRWFASKRLCFGQAPPAPARVCLIPPQSVFDNHSVCRRSAFA